MKRTNTWADAHTTKEAALDLGDGITVRIPTDKQRYTIDQTAGRTVKVWDYVNNREQLIYGDTGLRDITALSTVPVTAGTITMQRVGHLGYLSFEGVKFSTSSSGVVLVVPSGLRPAQIPTFQLEGVVNRGQITLYGNVQIYNWTAGQPIYGSFTYPIADPWPTSLPGTAVGSLVV